MRVRVLAKLEVSATHHDHKQTAQYMHRFPQKTPGQKIRLL
jgi:hypothetical protein